MLDSADGFIVTPFEGREGATDFRMLNFAHFTLTSIHRNSQGETGNVRMGVVMNVLVRTIEDGAIRRTVDDCFKIDFDSWGVRRRVLRIRDNLPGLPGGARTIT